MSLGILLILIILSIKTVDETEVGILENKYYHYVVGEEETVQAGMHFIGFWRRLAIIEKVQRTMMFDNLEALTNNVLAVHLDVTMQYVIVNDYRSVYNAIYKFQGHGDQMTIAVSDAIRVGCQGLQSDQFYTDRSAVTEKMKTFVAEALGVFGFQLSSIQITEIKVPLAMDAAIKDLVDATQDIDVATNERAREVSIAENEKRDKIHEFSVNGAIKNETALATYNAAKELIDAQLYTQYKRIDIITSVIESYKTKFNATDKQIMGLMKSDQWIQMITLLGQSSGQANKLYLDHKPSAVEDLSAQLRTNLEQE